MVQTRSAKAKSFLELPTRAPVRRSITVRRHLGKLWIDHASFKRLTRNPRILAFAWPVDPANDRRETLRAVRFLLFAEKGLPRLVVENILKPSNLTDHRCGDYRIAEQHGFHHQS
jgi:hypothetical protein